MKKGANAIMIALGKAKPDSGESSGDEGDEETSEEETSASEEEVAAYKELKDALKAGDDETGAMALKNFVHVCMEKGY